MQGRRIVSEERYNPAMKDVREDSPGQRSRTLRTLSYPARQAWAAFRYVDGAYLRGHPELDLFPTARQRRAAIHRVVARFVWRWAFWKAVGKTMAFAILLGLVVVALLAALRTWYPVSIRALLPWIVVPIVMIAVIAGSFANRSMSRHVPHLLRHELLECGVPVCVACGYPLMGLEGPNCPECGRPFDAEVRGILGLEPNSASLDAEQH
jgi:hypothetical protein